MNLAYLITLFLAALLPVASPGTISPARSMDKKLAYVQANGKKRPRPNPAPTIFTEQEINAYLGSGEVKMPAGVESVTLHGHPGFITGTAQVDFDKVREGVHSSNPLLSLFSGVHEVEVATHAYGENGEGFVHVDSVSLDGVEVPHFLLELFVEKYVTARHPGIGLVSKFKLPDRIDGATVGEHQLTIIQK